jgi:hypothetical protein
MSNFGLPELTGDRLKRLLEVLKNAPRDPACGCVIISETVKRLIEALYAEEGHQVDIGNPLPDPKD